MFSSFRVAVTTKNIAWSFCRHFFLFSQLRCIYITFWYSAPILLHFIFTFNLSVVFLENINRFCRAMLCISAAYAVMRCLCVCVCLCVCSSVTFVDCVKTSNRILRLFSPSGIHTILVFPHQTSWHYSDGNPLKGASNARGYEKMTIFDQHLALSPKCCNTEP